MEHRLGVAQLLVILGKRYASVEGRMAQLKMSKK
jgi:hypothetical protein